jgi:hypothetical protein
MLFSTSTLVMVNAMLAMASPLAKRDVETEYKVHTVTEFVYPDGSPATAYGSDPTPYVYYNQQQQEAAPEPEYAAPAPQAPAQGGSSNLSNPGEDFVQNSLYHHNVHRANHSAPDVSWSESLASSAQELANSCNYGHNTEIGGGGYGQNIAMYAATNDLGTEVQFIRTSITEYWYNKEIDLYGNAYGSEPGMGGFHEWGHFSQIVWKGTTQVGCAVAYCGSGLASYPGYYSVCNYSPPGNYQGEYGANVGAPLGYDPVAV